MANPSQRDYGHEGSETPLVPGSLRLYRHFRTVRNELYPMNNSNGTNPYRRPAYMEAGPQVYVAECRKAISGTANWAQSVVTARLHIDTAHGESPAKNCSCGFYAHYEPTTDFYPDMDWNLALGDNFGDDQRIIVKAVVEGIGRVVMGTKGVRSQKMKIVALAPDWTKYRSREWARELENALTYDQYRSLRDNPQSYQPGEGERRRVHQLMSRIASDYGAQLFPHPDQLHETYPAQDVSELLDQPKSSGSITPTNLKGLSQRWIV